MQSSLALFPLQSPPKPYLLKQRTTMIKMKQLNVIYMGSNKHN